MVVDALPHSSLSFGTSSVPLIVAPEELDVASAPLLRSALADAVEGGAPLGIALDMGATTFIDSRGMAELLVTRKRLRGRPVRLVRVQPSVQESMRLLGIDILFELYASVETMIAELGEPPC